jgi:hypothetical protein
MSEPALGADEELGRSRVTAQRRQQPPADSCRTRACIHGLLHTVVRSRERGIRRGGRPADTGIMEPASEQRNGDIIPPWTTLEDEKVDDSPAESSG